MKTFLINCVTILAIFGLSSCSTSKFNYKSAYKFSHYNYHKSDQSINFSNARDEQVFVSLKPLKPYPITPSVSVLENLDYSVKKNIASESLKDVKHKLSKTEKRELRRKLKKEIKQIKSELKVESLKSIESAQAGEGMNEKIFIGILVGGAGLILLILKVASPLGVLALVAGLGLIVWGFIEKGTF